MNCRRLVSLLITMLILASPGSYAAGLTLTIQDIRNDKGSIFILVFDDEEAFENLAWYNAADYAELPARTDQLSYSFSGLDAGPYAVFVLHDENGDQDLNYDGERLLEGIAVSGASASTTELDFQQASVTPGHVVLSIYYDD